MAGEPGGSFANNGAIIVAILSLGALIWGKPAPLQSERPAPAGAKFTVTSQFIDSPLWDDPFAAVDAWRTEPAATRANVCYPTPVNDPSSGDQEFVLGVVVGDDANSAGEEDRRRQRYALVSAMNAAGFAPVNGGGLRLLSPRSAQPPASDGAPPGVTRASAAPDATTQDAAPRQPGTGQPVCLNSDDPIPYERFRAKSQRERSVNISVLWLKDRWFREEGGIDFVDKLSEGWSQGGKHVPFYILGPRSSDSLSAIIKHFHERFTPPPAASAKVSISNECDAKLSIEVGRGSENTEHVILDKNSEYVVSSMCNAQKNQEYKSYNKENKSNNYGKIKNIKFYAVGPTVDDQEALYEFGINGADVATYLAPGIDLKRIGDSDFRLAKQLCWHLQERGVRGGEDQPILLLSESDTFYGRSFAKSMTSVLKTGSCRDPLTPYEESRTCPKGGCDGSSEPNWIVRRTYLRGLDGAVAKQTKANDANRTAASAEAPKSGALEPSELPFGTGQFDYLRRLSAELQAAQDRPPGKAFAAIGLIGADTYDKLYLLKALKADFPDAIFFTTDYDALLTSPDHLRITRNLLVASNFGPALDPRFQKDVLPFRDAYQTATFYAAQYVLAEACDASEKSMRSSGVKSASPWPPESCGYPGSVQPAVHEISRRGDLVTRAYKSETSSPAARLTYAMMAAFCGVFIGATSYLGRRRNKISAPGWANAKDNGSAISFLVHAFLFYVCWQAIALVFLVVAAVTIFDPARVAFTLSEPAIFTAGVSAAVPVFINLLAIALGLWLIILALFDLQKDRGQLKDDFKLATGVTGVEAAWNAYSLSCGLAPRLRRVICIAGVAFLGLFGVFYAFGIDISCPGHTEFVRRILLYLTWINAAIAIFLVTLVADATYHCYRFVEELSKTPSQWSSALLSQYADETGLIGIKAHTRLKAHAITAKKSVLEEAKALNDWIDLDFIGKHTKTINILIWFPFGFIAVLMFSRSSIFADFPVNLPLLSAEFIGLAVLGLCAVALNFAAERARNDAIAQFTKAADMARGVGADARADAWNRLVQRAHDLTEGSFRFFLVQPAITAALLPFSSIGLPKLVEWTGIFGI